MSQIKKKQVIFLLAVGLLFTSFGSTYAQRARFDDFFSSQATPQALGNGAPPPRGLPTIINTPAAPPPTLQNPIVVGQPNFGTPPNFGPNQNFPIFPRGTLTNPGVGQPVFSNPAQGQAQPNFLPPPQFPRFNSNAPAFQGSNANWQPPNGLTWPQQAWASVRDQFLPRLLERPRARQTYLPGNNGNELNMSDIEIATTLNYPNFLQTNQPLKITPGFIFHWWDGPDSTLFPGFDLPARVYSSYLTLDHVTNPQNNNGIESSLTIGYYSDFDNTSTDAIRITGRFLGWQRLNSYTVAKLGVEYLDRVDVKLLPAFGLTMTPNPDMKLDLYFPRPKLSHRIPNINNFEAWVYVGGEYGGGSWAIDRADGTPDQIDVNDVRSFLGIEWMGPKRVTGFFEFGYVFEREILYRSVPLNKLDLQDTLMIRSGFAF
ncbi:MAG: hypothetical protein AAF939_10940 [Planctomycetota bacterium]